MARLYMIVRICLFILAGGMLVVSCSAPLVTVTPATPTCSLLPQTTGEKYVAPTVQATPPARVRPGQTITIAFTGNYLILNNAISCAGTVTGYMHSDEQPGFAWGDRAVEVRLDDQVLSKTRCAFSCSINVTFPGNLTAGVHKLTVRAPWEITSYTIQVD